MRLRILVAACSVLLASCSTPSAQRATTPGAVHPLDVLSAEEIRVATAALRDAGQLQGAARVVIVETDEPDKARVLAQPGGGPIRRVARAVLYDWATGRTSESRVDLATRRVTDTADRGVGEPPVRHVILSRATEIATADSRVVAALRARGVTDINRLTFIGGLREGETLPRRDGSRIITVSPYLWDETGERGSLPGFAVSVDLTRGAVVDIDNFRMPGPAPRAPAAGPVTAGDLAPLETTQPKGPSFRIRGSELEWDRWRLHFAVHPRRGLEVFDVSFRDGDRLRPVLYRGSLAELMTPYGDPSFGSWFPRDEGDYGMTSYSAERAQAIVGADAPAYATFAPASLAGSRGDVVTLDRAVAIYERDGGVLWRHAGDGRRARQLVLSSYATLDNYDYLFHWIFSQDGAIDVQVQLTGVMNVRPAAGEHPDEDGALHFAHRVAPGIDASNHQHFFAWRLDFDVDGRANRVVELNTRNAQAVLNDRTGEWFGMEQRTLRSERGAQRDIDTATARRWLVASSGQRNAHGQPTAYALVPGENAPPFQAPASAPRRKAPFIDHQLWVTRYDPAQVYASGEWVSLPTENDGVAAWGSNDESLVDEDAVLWYTHSVVHLPRPEDWPVMPSHTAGFRLLPVGFFAANPTAPRATAAPPR